MSDDDGGGDHDAAAHVRTPLLTPAEVRAPQSPVGRLRVALRRRLRRRPVASAVEGGSPAVDASVHSYLGEQHRVRLRVLDARGPPVTSPATDDGDSSSFLEPGFVPATRGTVVLVPMFDRCVFPGQRLPFRMYDDTPMGDAVAEWLAERTAMGQLDAVTGVELATENEFSSCLRGRLGVELVAESQGPGSVVCVAGRRFKVVAAVAWPQNPRLFQAEVVYLHEDSRRRGAHSGPPMVGAPHLPFVMRQFDEGALVRRVHEALAGLLSSEKLAAASVNRRGQSASEFSWWVARNLPVENEARLQLLHCASAVHRLRLALELLNEFDTVACASCGEPVCRFSDVFAMSRDGAQAEYVNAHGFLHETVTFRRLIDEARCQTVGRATAQDSWFAGYAWTIVVCAECGSHLGWRFTKLGGESVRVVARAPEPEAEEGANDSDGHGENDGGDEEIEGDADEVVGPPEVTLFYGLRRESLKRVKRPI